MPQKYGILLRIPKSQTARRPLPVAWVLREDDDDDVEKEISRQASKTSSFLKIKEQHENALEEDPSIFDYDGVFDKMKENVAKPKVEDRSERKSKYIMALLSKAKEREREHQIIYERNLIKQRSKEDHFFAHKDKFVTSAYKKKLAEQAKWNEEERLRQIREEDEDVSKKNDLSEFYFSLNINIAFGAETSNPSKSSSPKTTQEATRNTATGDPEIKDNLMPSKPVNQPISPPVTPHEDEEEDVPQKLKGLLVEEILKKEGNIGERFKRKDADLACARDRFLARKRMKLAKLFS